jgi:lipopolysaccharide transport system ATP-binding protein
VLAGIYEPTRGQVSVKGRITSLLELGAGLDPEATGARNIRLLASLRGYSPWRMASRVEEIIDFSGLGHFANMPVKSYSSGMTMRLLFAVATSFEHDVLLVEEWLSAGDESFVQRATERMLSVAEQSRVIVTATHSLALAEQVCNKVLYLDHGQPMYFGSINGYRRWYEVERNIPQSAAAQ